MRSPLLASVLCVVFAGCASSSSSGGSAPALTQGSAPSRAGLLFWVVNQPGITIEVEGDQLFGSNVRLTRVREGGQSQLRGSVFERAVSITFQDGKASGLYDSQPFNLYLEGGSPTDTRVRGLVGGELSNYEIAGNKWTGHIGRCGYDMTGSDGAFEGFRSCGGRRDRVRIEMGSAFSTWTPLEKATVLALLMGS